MRSLSEMSPKSGEHHEATQNTGAGFLGAAMKRPSKLSIEWCVPSTVAMLSLIPKQARGVFSEIVLLH